VAGPAGIGGVLGEEARHLPPYVGRLGPARGRIIEVDDWTWHRFFTAAMAERTKHIQAGWRSRLCRSSDAGKFFVREFASFLWSVEPARQRLFAIYVRLHVAAPNN